MALIKSEKVAMDVANASLSLIKKVSDGEVSVNASMVALYVMELGLIADDMYSTNEIPSKNFRSLLGVATPLTAAKYVKEAVNAGLVLEFKSVGYASSYRFNVNK